MTTEGLDNLTPAMRQYHTFKKQYPEAILFFRMGDFYETFYEDAKTCARVLGIALTTRNKGENPIPLAGVPYHAVDNYLRKMIRAGYKVAVCEQVEDPALAKGVVKREVVRLVTPGTLTEASLLDERTGNYLAAVSFAPAGKSPRGGDKQPAGLAWVEMSTGAFYAQTIEQRFALDELVRIRPAECLISEENEGLPVKLTEQLREITQAAITRRPGWAFDRHHTATLLTQHFGTAGLEGFGFAPSDPGIIAAGVLIDYLRETQKTTLGHISRLQRLARQEFLQLDQATLRSLEIERTLRDNNREGSLLHSLDETRTAMGARTLRTWMCYPLNDLARLEQRQDAVAELVQLDELRETLRRRLGDMADVERITARISTGRASPRDLAALGQTLRMLPELRTQLEPCTGVLLSQLARQCDTLEKTADLIEAAIDPAAGLAYRDGGVIRDGFDAEVDRLRGLCRDGATWLARYQKKLIDQTGLASLKVGFNKVFGYYVELSGAFRGQVPGDFVRKQTLKNAERYITDELKHYETEALTAQQRCKEREASLFQEVRSQVAEQTLHLQQVAEAVAHLDVLACLAYLARQRNYCRPELHTEAELTLVEGRHPVLEAALGNQFVPNDVRLNATEGRVVIITGPNMSGKSTYIRQAALLVLMAQMGSFIPAQSARIGLVDRIFTRVGASDELTRGQSTFMVEMTETANILNNATAKSLVILDEVGRGTSTYDGLALAWAITEYIATAINCRTLFATHYHEITELADILPHVANYNVAVREWKDEVVFLHKIIPGRTDKSYGIHVARLAGIPKTVLERGREILTELEDNFAREAHVPQLGGRLEARKPAEPTLFDALVEDPLLEKLRGVDINQLTPMQAINLLHQIKIELENRQA